MATTPVAGCNSGIGHAMAQIALKEGYHVHALDVTRGEKLEALKSASCDVDVLDVTDVESIQLFKAKIGDQAVDVLLNVAGIMAPSDKDTLSTCDLQTLERTFAVNAFGPFLLTQALLPNMLSSVASPRRLAVVSSRVGSMGDNSSGGAYAYRASKSAANSLFKNLAIELRDRDVAVTLLHPGFTNTGLGAGIADAPGVVEPDVAAAGLWKIVRDKGVGETGRFWHRDGYELPW